MRRRGGAPVRPGEIPEWLRTFDPADWVDADDLPPLGWEFGSGVWQQIQARERWREAGMAWLAEVGYRGSWFSLVCPSQWSSDPHRLSKGEA